MSAKQAKCLRTESSALQAVFKKKIAQVSSVAIDRVRQTHWQTLNKIINQIEAGYNSENFTDAQPRAWWEFWNSCSSALRFIYDFEVVCWTSSLTSSSSSGHRAKSTSSPIFGRLMSAQSTHRFVGRVECFCGLVQTWRPLVSRPTAPLVGSYGWDPRTTDDDTWWTDISRTGRRSRERRSTTHLLRWSAVCWRSWLFAGTRRSSEPWTRVGRGALCRTPCIQWNASLD